MLLVKAWVGVSKIHGLGLIAHEFIPKDTVVWRLVPGFDLTLTDEELLRLPAPIQEHIIHYGFFHPTLKKHILCVDDDRFTNHSDEANLKFLGDHSIVIAIQNRWFVAGCIMYMLSAFGWVFTMRHIKLASIGVVYSLSMIILLAVLGTLVFGETLNRFEIIGFGFAVVAILLLGRFAG